MDTSKCVVKVTTDKQIRVILEEVGKNDNENLFSVYSRKLREFKSLYFLLNYCERSKNKNSDVNWNTTFDYYENMGYSYVEFEDFFGNEKTAPAACQCDLWKGCTCGAITPYQPKWS